eukprot:jgi/Tetstr1/459497/TSEL_004864.t1
MSLNGSTANTEQPHGQQFAPVSARLAEAIQTFEKSADSSCHSIKLPEVELHGGHNGEEDPQTRNAGDKSRNYGRIASLKLRGPSPLWAVLPQPQV